MIGGAKFRSAVRKDKLWIARAMRFASEGIVDFLFSGLPSILSVDEYLSLEVARKSSFLSYKNTLIVEVGNEIAGIITCYPGLYFSLPEIPNFVFTREKIQSLRPFYAIDLSHTFYIDTLFVAEKFRNQGLAKKLLEKSLNVAKNRGFSVASLYVWETNSSAIALYRKLDFVVIKSVRSSFFPFKNRERLLLYKNL